MTSPNRPSPLVKVLLLVGLLPLLAGLFGGLFIASQGSWHSDWPAVVLVGGSGVALVAVAIALDRWACRQQDQDRPGFDVIPRQSDAVPEGGVPPTATPTTPSRPHGAQRHPHAGS